MQEDVNNLTPQQLVAFKNETVFKSVYISKETNPSYPEKLEDGVVFVATDVKLVSKDGSNNLLASLGLWKDENVINNLSAKYFRPTTFEELIVAFQYSDSNLMQPFFRNVSDNNTNLNKLLSSFLKNNLVDNRVNVKELSETSFKIKDIITEKAEIYYEEKECFYQKKIQKYEDKIEELRSEQISLNSFGESVESEEIYFGELVENFSSDHPKLRKNESAVSTILKYYGNNKETGNEIEDFSQMKIDDMFKDFNVPTLPKAEDFEQ